MPKGYETPVIRELGSLEELTLQQYNKVGTTPDIVTTINNGIVGSVVPIP